MAFSLENKQPCTVNKVSAKAQETFLLRFSLSGNTANVSGLVFGQQFFLADRGFRHLRDGEDVVNNLFFVDRRIDLERSGGVLTIEVEHPRSPGRSCGLRGRWPEPPPCSETCTLFLVSISATRGQTHATLGDLQAFGLQFVFRLGGIFFRKLTLSLVLLDLLPDTGEFPSIFFGRSNE